MFTIRAQFALVVLGIAIALLTRTLSRDKITFPHPQSVLANITLSHSEDAVSRLSQLIKHRTVSDSQSAESHARHPEQLRLAREHLQKSYPSIWKHLTVETVAEFSLLIRWQGSNTALNPVLFVSHLDVVPATEGDSSEWSRPPFGGDIHDNFIWGRGAMDLKFMVIALLEAVTHLLESGWTKPERTLYLAFGHDEEVGGDLGAGAMASLLASRGVTLDFVVDEGGPILVDGLPSLLRTPTQIALVGTAEKGYNSILANVSGQGGHAMTPPTDHSTVPAIMSSLVQSVDQTPPTPQLVPPVTHFMQALAPACPNPFLRFILRHCENRLFGPLLARLLTLSSPNTAAVARTTVGVTRMNTGSADNVLPDSGSVMFNFRLLPGHTLDYPLQYLRNHLGKFSSRIRLQQVGGQKAREATPVSSPSSEQFKIVARAIYETVQPKQGIVAAPHLMTGASDSRHYLDITANGVYRFFPLFMNLTAGDVSRVHGIDERIKVDDFLQAIKVYIRMIQLACGDRNGSSVQ
ncbi:hypothetical protein ABBQ38_002728 [Trebouxia sp. C0009 RCD-2024]